MWRVICQNQMHINKTRHVLFTGWRVKQAPVDTSNKEQISFYMIYNQNILTNLRNHKIIATACRTNLLSDSCCLF